MPQFPLSLLFKGKRNYHQGGDLYLAAQKIVKSAVGKNSWINHIVFRGFASNACELILGEINNAVDMESIRAKCTVQHDGQVINATIIETKNSVTGSYSFDENKVTKEAVIEGQCVRQKSRAGFSPIEEVIVLTKILHNQLVPLQSGRWIFSQLDLTEPFAADQECCYAVTLKQNLAGRMTVSQVSQHEKIIGKIRFTATSK